MKEIEKPMYLGAKAKTFEKAQTLRKEMTVPEKLLWEKLNKNQLEGLKFRRQHPINKFIADFYCHELKLVIEVDGGYHDFQKEYDEGRTAELGNYGIRVIRIKNEEVESDINSVIQKIKQIIEDLKNQKYSLSK